MVDLCRKAPRFLIGFSVSDLYGFPAKEVKDMFPVPIAVQAFIAGAAAGRQICDLVDD